MQTNGINSNDTWEHINYLTYYLYDSVDISKGTERLRKIEQMIKGNYGSFTDSIPAGNYFAFFVGAKKSGYNIVLDQLGMVTFEERYILTYGDHPIDDTFTAFLQFKIGPGSRANKEIVLKRAVAKISVKILDAVPANANKIVLSVGNATPGFDLVAQAGQSPHSHMGGFEAREVTVILKQTDMGKKGFSFDTYVFPWQSTTHILRCYDALNNVIAFKYFESPAPDANMILTCQGNLFDGPSTFNVTVDNKWQTPVQVPFSN